MQALLDPSASRSLGRPLEAAGLAPGSVIAGDLTDYLHAPAKKCKTEVGKALAILDTDRTNGYEC
jgi:hypothetical protein